jgi:hypothetical protein
MKPENIKEQELNEEQLDEATGGALKPGQAYETSNLNPS